MIDPSIAATTFATIVGLICNFKQERREEKALDREAFLLWLEDHKHQDLKEFILRSNEISAEIDHLIKADTQTIISKLEKIDSVLVTILGNIDGLQGMAHALSPNGRLSEQAINILRQLVNSTSDEFGRIPYMGGVDYPMTSGGEIQITEPRFADDDLNVLTSLGLLNYRMSDGGTEFYGITRDAVRLIEAVDNK
jgi:hypothetical protein